jgi:hypothetical protein
MTLNFENETTEALLKLRDAVNAELDKRLNNYEQSYNKIKEIITPSSVTTSSVTPSSPIKSKALDSSTPSDPVTSVTEKESKCEPVIKVIKSNSNVYSLFDKKGKLHYNCKHDHIIKIKKPGKYLDSLEKEIRNFGAAVIWAAHVGTVAFGKLYIQFSSKDALDDFFDCALETHDFKFTKY